MSEKVQGAKQAVSEGLDAAARKVDAAKAAVGEKADAAKQIYDDAKQKVNKADEELKDDKRYTMLKQALEDMPIGDPVIHQVCKGLVEEINKSAHGVQHIKDMLSDDPARQAAGMAGAKQTLREVYDSTYPVAGEGIGKYLDEKAKGASTESAAISGLDHGIKYMPFANAEGHFEKAADAYAAGDRTGTVNELASGAHSFVNETVKIASFAEMAAAGGEYLAGRGGAAGPKLEAPQVEAAAPGQPPVEIVPDKIAPGDLENFKVPAEGPPLQAQPQDTARAPEPAGTANSPSQIDMDLSDRQPGPALEPSPRDLPQTGDTPGLDTRERPFAQPTVPRGRGEPSAKEDLTGTDRRTGMAFNERNAAEIVNNLRVEYDPSAGRPVQVSYDLDARSVQNPAVSDRGFARDWSTEGAQGTNSAYKGSGYDRGHAAQREAFNGSVETERAADLHTNIVPMTPELNRGAGSPWREAERATVDLAKQYGSVRVEVEVHYAENAPALRDGTPIPDSFVRRVTGPDGMVLREDSFTNRTVRVDPSITGRDGRGSAGDDSARIRIDSSVSSEGPDDPTQQEGARLRDEDIVPEPSARRTGRSTGG